MNTRNVLMAAVGVMLTTLGACGVEEEGEYLDDPEAVVETAVTMPEESDVESLARHDDCDRWDDDCDCWWDDYYDDWFCEGDHHHHHHHDHHHHHHHDWDDWDD